jgi:predicted nucleic acid-binding Zn ribbon protein
MQPMRTGLEKIILEALQHTPPQEAPVLAWPFACGPAVANKTRPLSFADGILTIEVADANWRAQLMDMAPQFLGRINQLVSLKVERLRFIVPPGK